MLAMDAINQYLSLLRPGPSSTLLGQAYKASDKPFLFPVLNQEVTGKSVLLCTYDMDASLVGREGVRRTGRGYHCLPNTSLRLRVRIQYLAQDYI